MLDDDVLRYYNEGMEQDRLADPRRSIEFLRTMDILHRHLPPPPAKILDIGGGPGRYALALAAAGYQMTLVDPVPLHLDQARAASAKADSPLAEIADGDARNLRERPDHSFDAVLLLGPLYHLVKATDRARAWTEACRVTRDGGRVIAAGVSRYYTGWEMLSKNKLDLPGTEALLERHINNGQHRNPSQDYEQLWTTAYLHDPDELAAEAAAAQCRVIALLAVEGPAKLLPDIAERIQHPVGRGQVMRLLERLEDLPTVLGTSEHVLAVAEPRCAPPVLGPTPRASDLVHAVSHWIDEHPANKARDPEARLWGRVTKTGEEVGEVIRALVAAFDHNPRKGQSGDMTQVQAELLDVAMTAMCAVAHLNDNDPEVDLMGLLAQHIAGVSARAGVAP
ncbi:methyltransferase domain-containing protein [Streptomyces sp. NBC_00989]|uniref:methyltransferase domain-containing protein n=1 Tax=Streptomyces sp. NBC_00989 TaxID=2903705 RepID=UPI003867C65B|nr:methyltransferase domain-containing protein [Streptomyces sp. NBC_00989]